MPCEIVKPPSKPWLSSLTLSLVRLESLTYLLTGVILATVLVPLTTIFEPLAITLQPHAPRSTPHASRLTPAQRGQLVRRPSPAGYCLPPTADLSKSEQGPISTSGPLLQYVTKPGDCYGEIDPFLPLRRGSPVDRSLVAKALNASGFRRACSMAISRNARSLLDFPEFAQAVRYGVPETPKQLGVVSPELRARAELAADQRRVLKVLGVSAN